MSNELLVAIDDVVIAATTPPAGWEDEGDGRLWNTEALMDAVEKLVRLRQGGAS